MIERIFNYVPMFVYLALGRLIYGSGFFDRSKPIPKYQHAILFLLAVVIGFPLAILVLWVIIKAFSLVSGH